MMETGGRIDMTRRLLTPLAIAIALLTIGAERPAACSCIGPIVACESAWTTDAVFVGKVLNVGPVREAIVGRIPWRQRLVHIDVQESFKGLPPGEVEITTGAGGGDCGYDFVVGRTYIVYAHRHPTTGQLGAGICSRTGPIEEATEDLAYLRGPFVTPSDLGVIRGTVSRHDPPAGPNQPMRQAPFAGADLRLEGYAQAYMTRSAGDGSYEFRVPAGEYRLFTTVRDGVYAWPGAAGRPVTLRDTRGCAVVDVAVRPDGRIAGRLIDSAGAPVPFMSVELVAAARLRSTSLSASTRTLTDERGHFEFKEIDPGVYASGLTLRRNAREGVDLAVWINADGNGQPATTVMQPEGRVDLGDVRLPSGVSTLTVAGVVVDGAGKPVRAAQVRFIEPGPTLGMLGAPVTTDGAGRFSLSVVAGRAYRLSVEWFPPVPGERRFYSARSEPFEAAGAIKPFRLVLADVR
jgi:hypothetical protein